LNGYRLTETISKPKQATVYKAVKVLTGKTVAIKHIPVDSSNERAMRSLCREVYLMLKLTKCGRNKYTVKLIDVFYNQEAQFES